jgi:hypothetical protein
LSQRSRHSREALLVLAAVASMLVAACGSVSVTPSPTVSTALATAPTPASSPVTSSSPVPIASTSQTATSTGFPFAADDIVAYYQSQGYACTAQKPSTKALGYFVRTCQKVDAAGRTLLIGVVTDPRDGLANGFASVQGTVDETFLAPIDALEPLAGFLGVMLGEDRGSAILTWLAGHLGDTYAQTTSGSLAIATYTASPDDHSKLYVEVANQAYLDASAVPSS